MATVGEVPGTLEPLFTVSAVARRLGIAPSTLRTWDRRYGLGPSGHLAGRHRRYAPSDLSRLIQMRRLTLDGVPPAQAARIVLSGTTPVLHTSNTQPIPNTQPSSNVRTAARLPERTPRPVPLTLRHTRPGTTVYPRAQTCPRGRTHGQEGEPLALPPPPSSPPAGGISPWAPFGPTAPGVRGLTRAASALDSQEIARIFRTAVREHGTIRAWEHLAVPVFQALGDRWQTTAKGVETEHVFTEAILGVLRSTAAELHRPLNTRPVLLGCAAGDRHTVPVHSLAAALAERGVSCRVLGAAVPDDALVCAVRRSGPAAVFLFARMPLPRAEVLPHLFRQRPAPTLILGGSGWEDLPLPAGTLLARSLPDALSQVVGSLELSQSVAR
jgi:MerR family transcriptional regulator, light-induced transcriptional regulator